MGGTAPANQLRLSFTGSEDGEAETETCRAAKPLWRTTTRTSRPVRAQLTEPPYADRKFRGCGGGKRAPAPPWQFPAFRGARTSPLPIYQREPPPTLITTPWIIAVLS